LRLYLYHIPQVTGVAIGQAAIDRLLASFPGVVAGIKDSSGDLAHSVELVRRFPSLDVFVGHEPHLPRLLAAGGAGTICGIANLYPDALRALHDAKDDASRASALEFVTRVIEIVKSYSLMPAIKAVRAILSADPAWYAVRPPLITLDEAARRTLATSIAALSPRKAAA
jgi:4-hydroxy-tetrahydrodipicolinate synthase